MKKIFYFLIILISGLFFLAIPSLAIIKTSGEMIINYHEPLFSSSTVWYPGLTLRNTIEVKNTGKSTRSLGIKATNTSQIERLAEALMLKVDENGRYVFGDNEDKTLKDFWNKGDFEVADLGPYETKTIGFTISMPGSLSNEYQGREVKFDLMIGFLNQSSTSPTDAGKILGLSTQTVGLPSTPPVKSTLSDKNFYKYFAIFIAFTSIIASLLLQKRDTFWLFRKKLFKK
ncbi:hypothetical protein HZA75_03475 [Candidatus Roizmanbacteria bacterium]|nr:hypothetical protein [Candidatus Roizmanbacteria bacterium]